MNSIAQIEKHPKRNVGYSYLISFNNKKDAMIAKEAYHEYFIDSRTMDCQTEDFCTEILYDLNSVDIKNVDCGIYQINAKFWKMSYDNYFNSQKSYEKACTIIENNTKNDFSLKNIAAYHSKTKKYNERYQKKLIEILNNN